MPDASWARRLLAGGVVRVGSGRSWRPIRLWVERSTPVRSADACAAVTASIVAILATSPSRKAAGRGERVRAAVIIESLSYSANAAARCCRRRRQPMEQLSATCEQDGAGV
jgi:hypothetical protein